MKTYRFFLFLIALSLTASLLSSCSTAKLSAEELQRTKNLSPAEGKALVYILRPSMVGSLIKFDVSCDGISLGSTTGKRFIYANLEPGVRKLLGEAENKEEIFLEVEAGKTYYLEQQAKMGLLMARTGWNKLTDSEGKKKLGKCKLSGDCAACK
jgi:hypothetical protein